MIQWFPLIREKKTRMKNVIYFHSIFALLFFISHFKQETQDYYSRKNTANRMRRRRKKNRTDILMHLFKKLKQEYMQKDENRNF